MLRLGASIASFAPAVGLPLCGARFDAVASWLEKMRQERDWWLQGFPLRGCAASEVRFDSVEMPWCGISEEEGKLGHFHFKREFYRSFKHWFEAQLVLKLYDSPGNCIEWLRRQCNSDNQQEPTMSAARLIINQIQYTELGVQTCSTTLVEAEHVWLELNCKDSTGGNASIAYRLCNQSNGATQLVFDTLHFAEREASLGQPYSYREMTMIAQKLGLVHWQPSRETDDGSGKPEIWRLLDGQTTESVDRLRRLRGESHLYYHAFRVAPIVMEPSIYHWRQLAGPRSWLSVAWVQNKLVECAEALEHQLTRI